MHNQLNTLMHVAYRNVFKSPDMVLHVVVKVQTFPVPMILCSHLLCESSFASAQATADQEY